MKRRLSVIALALSLGTWSQLSAAAIVDFEDIALTPGGSVLDFFPDASGGYLFTSPSNHIHRVNQFGSFGDSGSTNLMIHDNGGANAGNGLAMSKIGGGTFDINSIMLSEGFSGFGAASIHVIGNLFGGGTVTVDFILDGIFDGAGGVNDFETFNFGAGWANLTSVSFGGIGGTPNEHAWSVDNIVVDGSDVPEPAMLGLMAASLVGLGLSRRKRA